MSDPSSPVETSPETSPKTAEGMPGQSKSPGELTAYERWELPVIQEGQQAQGFSNPGQKVKPLTADDIERIRADAYQDGLKQGIADGRKQGKVDGHAEGLELGREQGLSEGRKQAADELQQHKASLDQLCQSLLKPIENTREQVEQVLLNTTLALVRAVIHGETKQNSEVVRVALQRSLDSLPKHASHLRIHLNPQDHKLVADIISNIDAETSLQANPQITRGGCIVESSQQIVDNTIETRFQHTVQKMLLEAAREQNFEAHQETPSTLENHSDYHANILEAGDQDDDQHDAEHIRNEGSLEAQKPEDCEDSQAMSSSTEPQEKDSQDSADPKEDP